MSAYDQIKKAFQDIVAPELHALRGDLRVLDQRVIGLDQKMDGVDSRLSVKLDALRTETVALKAELIAEIRRLTRASTAWIESYGPRSTFANALPRWKPTAPANARRDGARAASGARRRRRSPARFH